MEIWGDTARFFDEWGFAGDQKSKNEIPKFAGGPRRTPTTPEAGFIGDPVVAVCYAMAHNSLVLSRDFHVSGSLLRCMTATISKVSFLIW